MLSKEAIEQYKKIYRNAYNIELNENEATEMANDLFEFMRAVYLPTGEEELITTQENGTKNTN
ncbi:MAG: hypothetical protein A2312_03475 [Candidatus Staskawiczbacteria bacterium RIFOXYB2_FULL_32_9]|uniref:Uncharacterized protein n=1 Tax=Candidatus Staskawiczbacteria bacterium RIFOXYD1_FULL_32_13 TaxID=1802234 RepID=A0A1G2JMJ3_9BACT|nr:MAG: hypothetical protein UR22_C0024G0012 [Parcubacteria group bacterium GW2011_GWC2_32_10]OGZ79947.1 MAG: hypothetical protein A2256_03115 [Candidatus Staskawiczbacteria bacterium RIFOXYA2_FULL_32_7]OGZ83320.1 MAG: hypothetical protein A2312_03475 [Candidatus Staskawiczbacteria bacterium RIFOXYB2_FULL_32_9]OGZ88367.1 MAG: hypothetical protein A2561_02090 [Candidatus Staskawiczbacteria bacterium RIFOXYD1_FULL_32_13]